MTNKDKINNHKWYPLDNAAKIFPAVSSSADVNVYRVAARLKDKVDPSALSAALCESLERYPAFKVKLRRGVFWYFFEYNEKQPILDYDDYYPCSAIDFQNNNEYLFKLSYYENRVALDVFHSIADATGALEFLKTVLYAYFKRLGLPVESQGLIRLPDVTPSRDEYADSFKKYYDKHNNKTITEPNAFKLKGTPIPYGCTVTYAWLSTSDLLAKAHEYGATISQFIAAVIAYTVYKLDIEGTDEQKPINVLVPVNMRRLCPSITSRNFVTPATISIYQKDASSFSTVLESVKKQFNERVNHDYMVRQMSQTVKMEKILPIRLVPNVLKNIIMKLVYASVGSRKITANFSNVGQVKMPAVFSDYIESFEFLSSVPDVGTVFTSAISFGDRFQLGFLRNNVEADFERKLISLLRDFGLDFYVEGTNYEEV